MTKLSICNYNYYEGDSIFKLNVKKSYLRVWGISKKKKKKKDILDKTFSSGDGIKEGTCVPEQNTELLLNTNISQYYMQVNGQGSLEGTRKTGENFCRAYSFNPFDLKYDYGDPPCNVTVSIIQAM